MENITKWYRVRRDVSLGDPFEAVREIAQVRYDTADKPVGFAVFRAMQYDMRRPRDAYRLIYFSPVACSWCMPFVTKLDGRESESPAEAPEGVEGIAFVCGDEDFAHGLLK